MCYWFTFLIKYMVFCSEMNTGGRGEAVVRACDSHQFGLGSGLAMYTRGSRFQLRPKNKVRSPRKIPSGQDYCQTQKTVNI